MSEQIDKLREKFDALLIAEVKAYGGIPDFQGRCGRETMELREAIAELLALSASGAGEDASPKETTTTYPLAQAIWICRHQIGPNIYGLKHAALMDVLAVLESKVAGVDLAPPQEPT